MRLSVNARPQRNWYSIAQIPQKIELFVERLRGTLFVKRVVVGVVVKRLRTDEGEAMKGPAKAFAAKLAYSLLVIALLAPILALSMIAGGRVGAITQGNGNEWLLIALAFGGAAASALNGLGRSTRSQGLRNRVRVLSNDRRGNTSAVQAK